MSDQRAGSSRALKVGNCDISDASECFVIAEIGHNHQGDVKLCMEMFQAAKYCGVQAVKLQKRDNKALFTSSFYSQPYNSENSYGATYGLHREALEFGASEYRELKQFAESLGLLFFATAFDKPSVDFLEELSVPAYKVASGDLTNTPLLEYMAQTGKPMIMSTGAASLEDVQRAYDAVMPINPQLAILQCTATYPSAFEQLNLRVISTYREMFPECVIGYSGHDSGIAMALVAYCLGARIVEKHFTLNRAFRGTDHAFSLEPIGMKKMVRDLSRARVAMGDGLKVPLQAEESARAKMSKMIVASRALPAGHVLSDGDLLFKSPGGGLPPYRAAELYGSRLLRDLKEEEPLSESDVAAARPIPL